MITNITMPDRYTCSIDELISGDTFIKDGRVFIVIDHKTFEDCYDAVNLITGELHSFCSNDYLEKVSLDITAQYEAVE